MIKPNNISTELFLKILEGGIYTKLPGIDDKLTHYCVIDSDEITLLIAFSKSGLWHDGELSYNPHIVSWKDMNKSWFITKPLQETIKVFDYGKYHKQIHPYDVKTTGKHPIHMIEGGTYITECETVFDRSSDMGWFFLNKKDYEFFKSHLEEKTFEVDEDANIDFEVK